MQYAKRLPWRTLFPLLLPFLPCTTPGEKGRRAGLGWAWDQLEREGTILVEPRASGEPARRCRAGIENSGTTYMSLTFWLSTSCSRVGASMGQRDREVHNMSELSWSLGLLLLLMLLLSLTD